MHRDACADVRLMIPHDVRQMADMMIAHDIKPDTAMDLAWQFYRLLTGERKPRNRAERRRLASMR